VGEEGTTELQGRLGNAGATAASGDPLVFGVAQVAPRFDSSASLSGEHDGQSGGGVVVAVAHARTEQDDGVFEQAAVVILVSLHPV